MPNSTAPQIADHPEVQQWLEAFGTGSASAEGVFDQIASLVDRYLPAGAGLRLGQAVYELLSASNTTTWTTVRLESPVSDEQRIRVGRAAEQLKGRVDHLWEIAADDPPSDVARTWAIHRTLLLLSLQYLGCGDSLRLMRALDHHFCHLPRPRAPFVEDQPSLFGDHKWPEFCRLFDEWWYCPDIVK